MSEDCHDDIATTDAAKGTTARELLQEARKIFAETGYTLDIRTKIDAFLAQPEPEPFGYALAMRVLQSDLYHQLDGTERAECDALLDAAKGKALYQNALDDCAAAIRELAERC